MSSDKYKLHHQLSEDHQVPSSNSTDVTNSSSKEDSASKLANNPSSGIQEESPTSSNGHQHDGTNSIEESSNPSTTKRNQVTPLNVGSLSNSKSRPTLVSVRTQKSLNTTNFMKQNSSKNSLLMMRNSLQKSQNSLTYSKNTTTEENDKKGDELTQLEEGRQCTTNRSYESRTSNISYSVVSKVETKKWSFSKLLAKIPLSIKLLLIFVFSLACLVVFEGILIKFSVVRVQESQANTLLTIFTTGISDIIHELQKERGSSSLFLGSKGLSFISELETQRKATDLQLLNWNATKQGIVDYLQLSAKENIAKQSVEQTLIAIDESFSILSAHRNNISTLQFPVAKVALDFYTVTIKNMIDIVNVATSLGRDPDFLIKSNIYSLLMVMKETLGLKRATVSNAIAAGGFSNDFYVSYLYFRSRFDTMLSIIDSKTRNVNCYHYFEELSESVNNATITNMMESYLMASPFNLTHAKTIFTAQQWFWNVTLKIDELKVVENVIRDDILRNQKEFEGIAINELIGYTVGGVLGIILSSILSLIFSRTIQDLLRLHNETVHKFVPKEFMSIVQKDSVMDLTHGDYFEMELDVMFADIRGYTSICEKLTPDETFEFLNHYLSLVGPVVREHGGYIDKYLGDGILALFLKPGQSVLAAMEIQRRLLDFNKSKKYPSVRVGIGIARGKCAVGLIGEDQRVDPTIIGDTVNLSARLESLTKQYRVDILVTREVIESSPLLPTMNQRKIGRLAVVGRQQACWVFDILTQTPSTITNNSHKLKGKTKIDFESAIEIMYGQYQTSEEVQLDVNVVEPKHNSISLNNLQSEDVVKAIELLRKCVNRDPSDFVASMRLEKLEEMVNDVSVRSTWAFEDRLDTK